MVLQSASLTMLMREIFMLSEVNGSSREKESIGCAYFICLFFSILVVSWWLYCIARITIEMYSICEFENRKQ